MLGLLESPDDCADKVVEYNRRGAINSASAGSGGGGGGVDDLLKRLGNVETHVSELKSQFSAISATVSHLATAASVSDLRSTVAHLATAASVSDLRSEVTGILKVIPYLATKADLSDVKTAVASMEAAIIKWIIATTLTSAAMAFAIARFVH